MAVRSFGAFGSGDEILCAIGALDTQVAAGTFAAVIKPNTDGASNLALSLEDSGSTSRSAFGITAGNEVFLGIDNAATLVSAVTVSASAGWHLIAVTKTSGTNTPRMHKVILSSSAATHTNAASTIGNGTSPGGTGHVELGAWSQAADRADGLFAVGGVFTSVLSDGDIELLANGLQKWIDLGAAALWRLDQTSISTPVPDIIGAADETGHTGTTVVTGDDPPGFDWTLGIVLHAGPYIGPAPGRISPTGLWTPTPTDPDLIAAAGGPSASGDTSGQQRTDGTATTVKGTIGVATGTGRVSGLSTGAKGAIGASSGLQRAIGVAVRGFPPTGDAVGQQRVSGLSAGTKGAIATTATGQQHTSGATAGIKQAIGSATGQTRSSGAAVRGIPPTGAALGQQRINGLSTGKKNTTAAVAGQQRSSGTAAGVHRTAGAAIGQQRSSGIAATIKGGQGTATGQQHVGGQALRLPPVIKGTGTIAIAADGRSGLQITKANQGDLALATSGTSGLEIT